MLWEYIFHSVEWVEKWVKFFEQNCTVKWVIFLAIFCWLWYFRAENQKLVDKLTKMRFLINHFLIQILFFGTVLWHFSLCNFNFFSSPSNHGVVHFTQVLPPPTIKKLPTVLKYHRFVSGFNAWHDSFESWLCFFFQKTKGRGYVIYWGKAEKILLQL